VKPPREGCLQILLKELAIPAGRTLEVHVDTVGRISLGTAAITELFTRNVRRTERRPAQGADLAGDSLADGRGAFTTHGWEYSE
jgi:hypothetical protein